LKRTLLSITLLGLVLLLAIPLTGCSTETYNSIAEIKSQGWPADKVAIDVARISPFSGGVSYSETQDQYAFSIYDKTATYTGGTAYEDIIVVVKGQNINFSPKDGDFVTVTGELQSSDIGSPKKGWRYTQKAVKIYATDVRKTNAPEGW